MLQRRVLLSISSSPSLACLAQRSASSSSEGVSSASFLSSGTPAVSSHGRVKNTFGAITIGSRNSGGYYMTRVGGVDNMVHRLVARAFLGPPPTVAHWQVNHKDGDPGNNHVENLEWVTPSQNTKHSYVVNPLRRTSASTSKPILGRLRGTEEWMSYPSMKYAARELALNIGAISACCAGKRKTVGAYEFRCDSARVPPDVLHGEQWRKVFHPKSGVALSAWSVSSHGRVENSRHQISWGSRTSQGSPYRRVGVTHNGTTCMAYVHRLVARAFLGPAPSIHCDFVHHKDGDPHNNHVDNLEYVTASLKNIRRKPSVPHRSRLGFPILARSHVSGEWARYGSMREASRHLDLSTNVIARCCRGAASARLKYDFKFADISLPSEEWREIHFNR